MSIMFWGWQMENICLAFSFSRNKPCKAFIMKNKPILKLHCPAAVYHQWMAAQQHPFFTCKVYGLDCPQTILSALVQDRTSQACPVQPNLHQQSPQYPYIACVLQDYSQCSYQRRDQSTSAQTRTPKNKPVCPTLFQYSLIFYNLVQYIPVCPPTVPHASICLSITLSVLGQPIYTSIVKMCSTIAQKIPACPKEDQ